uniref:Uncharacterized protein n=1 Tax=Arundo donax TaxID=35708 RepID=A0A0A9G5G1_ARUDO
MHMATMDFHIYHKFSGKLPSYCLQLIDQTI